MSAPIGLGWPVPDKTLEDRSGLGWPDPVSRGTQLSEPRKDETSPEAAPSGAPDADGAATATPLREATEDARAAGSPNELGDAEPPAASRQEGSPAEPTTQPTASAAASDGLPLREETEAVRAEGEANEIAEPTAPTDPGFSSQPDAGQDSSPDTDEASSPDAGQACGPAAPASASVSGTDEPPLDQQPAAVTPTPDASGDRPTPGGQSPDVPGDQPAPAEGLGDGLGAVAQSWSQDLPGAGYHAEQRPRPLRARGAEAAANADVQSRFLGTTQQDARKSRLASTWAEPSARPVADAALFGEAGEAARDELAEIAASVVTEEPVTRPTEEVDLVQEFRDQEDAAAPAPTAPVEAVRDTPTADAPAATPTATDPTGRTTASSPAAPSPGQGETRAVAERLPRPRRTRILTVANQKGGVGKTTTTVNIAAALAQAGLRVLVIDLDPQGNASTALGIPHHAEVPSVYDVLVDGSPLADVVQSCPDVPNLLAAPATIDLAGAEIELVSLVAREMRLGRALSAYLRDLDGRDERLDYVLIDCPPSLGLLTINAFVAAEEVLIPIQCEYYALEGLSQLLKNIELIKAHLNPLLHVSTILLTMYDGRTRLSAQVADEVRRHFGKQVVGSTVPRSVRISEAPSHGQTVMTYDPTSSGALSYAAAAVEIARQGADEGGKR